MITEGLTSNLEVATMYRPDLLIYAKLIPSLLKIGGASPYNIK